MLLQNIVKPYKQSAAVTNYSQTVTATYRTWYAAVTTQLVRYATRLIAGVPLTDIKPQSCCPAAAALCTENDRHLLSAARLHNRLCWVHCELAYLQGTFRWWGRRRCSCRSISHSSSLAACRDRACVAKRAQEPTILHSQ